MKQFTNKFPKPFDDIVIRIWNNNRIDIYVEKVRNIVIDNCENCVIDGEKNAFIQVYVFGSEYYLHFSELQIEKQWFSGPIDMWEEYYESDNNCWDRIKKENNTWFVDYILKNEKKCTIDDFNDFENNNEEIIKTLEEIN